MACAHNNELTNLKNFDDPAVQLTDQLVKMAETHDIAIKEKLH
jgi:hypothetical protein